MGAVMLVVEPTQGRVREREAAGKKPRHSRRERATKRE
jgi:hypothetical protein